MSQKRNKLSAATRFVIVVCIYGILSIFFSSRKVNETKMDMEARLGPRGTISRENKPTSAAKSEIEPDDSGNFLEQGGEPALNTTHVMRSTTKDPIMDFSINSTRNVNETQSAMEANHGTHVGSKDYIRKKQIGINRENTPSAATSEKEPNKDSDNVTGETRSSLVVTAESSLPAELSFSARAEVMDENHRLIKVSAITSVPACTLFCEFCLQG
jgi:hypothetical protein